jgi:hypothetical protein
VYSADLADYKADVAAYDRLAGELNETYGDIVVTSGEGGPGALGLRAHRIAAWSSIETGTRRDDGTFEVTNEDYFQKVAEEDARTLRELQRDDPAGPASTQPL